MRMRRRKPTRRTALKRIAAGLGFGTTLAAQGFPTIWGRQFGNVVLTQVSSAGDPFTINRIGQEIEQDLGFKVKFNFENPFDIINTSKCNPKIFDVVDTFQFMVEPLWRTTNFQAITKKKISRWNDVSSVYRTGKLLSDSPFGQGINPSAVIFLESPTAQTFAKPGTETDFLAYLPCFQIVTSIAHSPAYLAAPGVQTWGAIVDASFKGQVGITADPQLFTDAALALQSAGEVDFEDVNALSREEILKAAGILSEMRNDGQFVFFQTFGEEVFSFVSGQVTIRPSMRLPAVMAIRDQGVPVLQNPLRDGNKSGARGLMLMNHLSGERLDAAYAYLNWHLEGRAGAFQARQGRFPAVERTARGFLSNEEAAYWFDGEPPVGIVDPLENSFPTRGLRRGGTSTEFTGNIAVYDQLTSLRPNGDLITSLWIEFASA